MRLNGPFYSFVLAFVLVSFLTFPISAGTLTDSCDGPAVSTSFKSIEWTSPGSSSCYSVYFEEPTAWFVRAAAGPTSAGVYLELPACSQDAGVRIIDRRLDSLLVDVREAGWRSFCFGQVERSGDSMEVQLVSRALGAYFGKEDPNESDPDPDPLVGGCMPTDLAQKEDPNESDPDPDPLMAGCNPTDLAQKEDPNESDPDPDPNPMTGGSTWAYVPQKEDPNESDPDPDPWMAGCTSTDVALKEDPNESDPDPDPGPMTGGSLWHGDVLSYAVEKEDPNESDPDPDPLIGGTCSRGARLAKACRLAGAWGAERIPACASRMQAEQWQDLNGDRLLVLVVEHWQELSIEATKQAELAIRDKSGHRIAQATVEGKSAEGLNVRLGPGVYWLDASGEGALRYRSSAF